MKTVNESRKIKIHAYNIDWAVEEEDVVDDMEGDPNDEKEVQAEIDRVKAKLPTELDFEITCELGDDIDQLVSDAISDNQGWLTNGFDYEIIKNKKSINENKNRKQTMKRINENQKVTLTIGQLKRLVKEGSKLADEKFVKRVEKMYHGLLKFSRDLIKWQRLVNDAYPEYDVLNSLFAADDASRAVFEDLNAKYYALSNALTAAQKQLKVQLDRAESISIFGDDEDED